MIPIRDTIRSRSFPIINWLIIALNTVVFLFENGLRADQLTRLVNAFGMVPTRLNLLHPVAILNDTTVLLTLVTSLFLHGGWLHLISNMWTLVIFGDNVEDRMGHSRYLLFYLLSGVAANLLQAYVFPTSSVPAVGASGAIAGVLGAYFLLYPRSRVVTLMPIFWLAWFVEIPSAIYLGFWFVLQLYSGVSSAGAVGGADMGGIAWWAHIGGFVFGMLAVKFFARRKEWYEYQPWQSRFS